MLSWITFSPLLAIVPILLVPRSRPNLIRWIAAAATFVPLVLAVYIFMTFDRTEMLRDGSGTRATGAAGFVLRAGRDGSHANPSLVWVLSSGRFHQQSLRSSRTTAP